MIVVRPAAAPPAITFAWAEEVSRLSSDTTTSTPITTPRTPVTSIPPRAPGAVGVSKVLLNANTVKIHWASPARKNVSVVEFDVYRGSGCVALDYQVRDRYNSSNSIAAATWSPTAIASMTRRVFAQGHGH